MMRLRKDEPFPLTMNAPTSLYRRFEIIAARDPGALKSGVGHFFDPAIGPVRCLLLNFERNC